MACELCCRARPASGEIFLASPLAAHAGDSTTQNRSPKKKLSANRSQNPFSALIAHVNLRSQWQARQAGLLPLAEIALKPSFRFAQAPAMDPVKPWKHQSQVRGVLGECNHGKQRVAAVATTKVPQVPH